MYEIITRATFFISMQIWIAVHWINDGGNPSWLPIAIGLGYLILFVLTLILGDKDN